MKHVNFGHNKKTLGDYAEDILLKSLKIKNTETHTHVGRTQVGIPGAENTNPLILLRNSND